MWRKVVNFFAQITVQLAKKAMNVPARLFREYFSQGRIDSLVMEQGDLLGLAG